MGEDVTNTVATETPQVQQTAEENVGANQEPQVNQQEQVGEPAENSNNEEQPNDGEQQVQQEQNPEQGDEQQKETYEQLQAKLNEYQLREEEDKLLREKLGIQDIDPQTFNYMNIDQQIVNEGKQVYLRLCNEFGIDANPNKIDASIEELKKTDPAKAYEFQRRFEALGDEVINKRSEVQQQNAYYEVNKFENDYGQILHASPALYSIMSQYIQTYGANSPNMYGQLKSVMDTIMPAYQEAFNAGRQYAMEDKAKKDTSQVSGGIATATQQPYTSGMTFTREQIGKMSQEEFAKYEKEIQRQMIEGKIQ